jgi:hypothetical protein
MSLCHQFKNTHMYLFSCYFSYSSPFICICILCLFQYFCISHCAEEGPVWPKRPH